MTLSSVFVVANSLRLQRYNAAEPGPGKTARAGALTARGHATAPNQAT